MRCRAIVLALVAASLVPLSCSVRQGEGPAVPEHVPVRKYYTHQITLQVVGKSASEVERILGKPDSVTGPENQPASFYYKAYKTERAWVVLDPDSDDPCGIVIVRFGRGVANDMEFRCW